MQCVLFTILTVGCSNLANPVNGQVSHTAGTILGQTATYSCNTGYNLVGGSTRTCQNTGVWSGSAPTCSCMLLLYTPHVSMYIQHWQAFGPGV